MSTRVDSLPGAFIWRRLHSLMGLWLVLFLLEHLVTNSQAALLLGESGKGFVRMVNGLHNLPYLQAIEIILLGIPIVIHMFWGVRYLFTAKYIHAHSDGTRPTLNYWKNRSYNWQRATSWILLILLTMHIVKFRFLEYPGSVNVGSTPVYYVSVSMDSGLYTVAQRLGVTLYDQDAIDALQQKPIKGLSAAAGSVRSQESTIYNPQDAEILQTLQAYEEKQHLAEALAQVKLEPNEVVAASGDFGTATLLAVRDTFKSPFWVAIYTIFVLSACFHAFNGLWTSMLTWGWVVKVSSQRAGYKFAVGLMILITFLGLMAVWGTYFLNLKT